MIRLGLTGSFAMGKTTIATMFVEEDIPVHDADAAVRKLYAPGGVAIAPVLAAFGDVLDAEGGIDREVLGQMIWSDFAARTRLERIVYPLLAVERADFLSEHISAPLVVLDIPLLFEHFGADRLDAVIVASCSAAEQERRALARPGVTRQRLQEIMQTQMPDADKRARADFVINTDLSKNHARIAVRQIIKIVRDHA